MLLESIALVGLPGSGKTRLQQTLIEQHPHSLVEKNILADQLSWFECSELTALANLPKEPNFVLCVIDVRSVMQAGQDDWLQAQLKGLLAVSHAVAFNFLEASALDDQAWWGRWMKMHAPTMPIVRVLNNVIPSSWAELVGADQPVRPIPSPSSNPVSAGQQSELSSSWQTFEFEVGRICLDHLLFGLDSSRQNLAMKIARVKGVVDTLEYENRVDIQGSALRWDMFAAEENAVSGVITIQGLDLDRAWLEELIRASLV